MKWPYAGLFLSYSVTHGCQFVFSGVSASHICRWTASVAHLHILFSSISCGIQCHNNDAWKIEGREYILGFYNGFFLFFFVPWSLICHWLADARDMVRMRSSENSDRSLKSEQQLVWVLMLFHSMLEITSFLFHSMTLSYNSPSYADTQLEGLGTRELEGAWCHEWYSRC